MSFVSVSDVIDGLHERFLTVDGFAKYNDAGALVNMVRYEPRAIAVFPFLYTLLDKFERSQAGQITTMRYRILHRVVLQWQDNDQSEQQMLAWVHPFCAAIDADPTLGGRVALGMATMAEASTGFASISGTKYRVIDFFSSTLTKAAVRSGI